MHSSDTAGIAAFVPESFLYAIKMRLRRHNADPRTASKYFRVRFQRRLLRIRYNG